MYPVLVVALIGAVIVLERTMTIVLRSRVSGQAFIDRVVQLVSAEKLDEAVRLCARSKSLLPDVGLLILRSGAREDADLAAVAAAALQTATPRVTRRLRYLPALAWAAVLLGALGAAHGARLMLIDMVDPTLAHARLASGFTVLGFGLGVAALFVVAHAWLASQSERLLEQANELSSRLVNALAERADVRLGHR
jgi:hypothetical protein